MDYQKFVSIFYKTLNEKPSTIYKFYDKDAILVWTPHTKDLTSEIRTKKVLFKFNFTSLFKFLLLILLLAFFGHNNSIMSFC
jgi:hypothetical protein